MRTLAESGLLDKKFAPSLTAGGVGALAGRTLLAWETLAIPAVERFWSE
jgi:hypothetical protein